jgi:hypothetical protein
MRQLFLSFFTILTSLSGYTQIQVSQEPRHHKVLENEWVRVLDVHVPPHDTTLMHKHSTPSVFLILSNTKTGSQTLIEPGKPSFADGNIWFEGFYEKPRIHRVWNEDTIEFHVMDIELPHTPSTSVDNTVNPPFSKLLFDEKPVRAFRITLPGGRQFTQKQISSPILVIGLSGPAANSEINNHPFTKKGDYLFIPAGTAINIANKSTATDQQFALLFLK